MLYQISKKPYDKVSLIYNGLMKHVDFRLWAEYIMDIASEYINYNSSLLELAAGTCKMAAAIQKKYPDIIATEISFPMMKAGNQKYLKKVCCNMTRLPFRKKFDFVYCTFDSINYLLTERGLMSLFSEVSFILNETGIFTFDASLENNSLEFGDVQVTEGDYKGYSFRRISSYNKRKKIHKNIFHIRSSSGEKFKEIHRQRIYSYETYFRLIKKSGLTVRESYEGFTFDNANADSERVQFVVGKKEA